MREQSVCSRIAIGQKKLRLWILVIVFFLGIGFSVHVKAADNVPVVEKVRMINSQDIEIYWSEEVTGAGWVESKPVGSKLVKQDQNYSITIDGKAAEINYYCWEEYNNYEDVGVIYYTENNQYYPDNPANPKTTIRLGGDYAIKDFDNMPEIKVTIKGNVIKGKTSNAYVPEQTITLTKADYVPYYTQERTLDCGVKVLGSEKARTEAVDKAKEMLEVILAVPEVANRMGQKGCVLAVYGEGEIAYDIPEHRFTYEESGLYVEGFGGTGLASIRDANVLRLKTGSYQTGYPDESILTHEFAHMIYDDGLSEEQQTEWINIYNKSIASGKWPNSYAGSNKDEYFATLSAMWFNAMDDTYDGNWDGTRGPINTREELKAYDKEAYDFLSKIYVSDRYLPSPWENGTVPNNYIYKVTDPVEENYTVKFVYNNGKSDTTKQVKAKSKVSKPSNPKRKGYTFKGWYLDSKKYSFNSKVTKDIVLQAKWTKVTVKKTSVKSLKAQNGKKVLVTITKLKDAEGYRITYAKNKKLTKAKKTMDTVSLKKTITKLQKGTYYIGVQAYKTDSTGKKVLGGMSAVKKVTVKK